MDGGLSTGRTCPYRAYRTGPNARKRPACPKSGPGAVLPRQAPHARRCPVSKSDPWVRHQQLDTRCRPARSSRTASPAASLCAPDAIRSARDPITVEPQKHQSHLMAWSADWTPARPTAPLERCPSRISVAVPLRTSGRGSSFGVASWRTGRSSVRGVLLPGPPDGVPHVGGVLRTPSAQHLELDILLESLEQPLPFAQHKRRSGDRELVYSSRRETLADQVGATTEGDPAVAGELARLHQRGVEAVNEQEAALGSGWSSVRWVSTINVPGNGLVPPQAPAASYMLRPTIPQPSPSVIDS